VHGLSTHTNIRSVASKSSRSTIRPFRYF